MFLWDKYKPEEITGNIKYWVDLWEDLIDNFTKNLYGLTLENPRLLLRDIIDEVESYNFKNTDNKKYFREKIGERLRNDLAIKNFLKVEFTLLIREFELQRWTYLKSMCKTLLLKFETGAYFKETLANLKDILLSDKDNKQSIRTLSQNLIIEFLIKGYSLKTTREFAKNVFDKYYIKADKQLITSFPHTSNWKYLLEGEKLKQEEYFKKVMAEIDSVTIPERIDKLEYYFFKKTSDNYFIFEIEGLKGNVDIWIGEVNFYSPDVKKYIKHELIPDCNSEIFDRKQKEKFVNAAVKISMVDSDGAKDHAIEKINKALDFLRVNLHPKTSFEILPSYLIVDEQGMEIGMGMKHKESESWFRWHNSLNLEKLKPYEAEFSKTSNSISEFLYKKSDKQNEIEGKISNSLHWYRKGEETYNYEDKLINYWVVLEYLFKFKDIVLSKDETAFSLAREIIPAMQGLKFIYDRGWVLYNYLTDLINSRQNSRQCLSLPQDLIEKCNLNPTRPSRIQLKPFIDNLDELNKFVERDIIKEKISSTSKFYIDSNYQEKVIKEFLDAIKEDILLIYRYRNMIMHNAHYDNTILPYFVEKIRKYAGDLLRTVIFKYGINKSVTIREVIFEQYYNMNEILEKLKLGKKIDFLIESPLGDYYELTTEQAS